MLAAVWIMRFFGLVLLALGAVLAKAFWHLEALSEIIFLEVTEGMAAGTGAAAGSGVLGRKFFGLATLLKKQRAVLNSRKDSSMENLPPIAVPPRYQALMNQGAAPAPKQDRYCGRCGRVVPRTADGCVYCD